MEAERNKVNPAPAPDVVRLVIAARRVVEARGGMHLSELHRAADAFTDRIPLADEPDSEIDALRKATR